MKGNVQQMFVDSSFIGKSFFDFFCMNRIENKRDILAVMVEGELKDLRSKIVKDTPISPLRFSDDYEAKIVLWNSAAFILAQAVKRLLPEAKLASYGIAREGFFYDFDINVPFSSEDLSNLEKEMKKIVKEKKKIELHECSIEEAKAYFRNEPYKNELLDECVREGVSVYVSDNFSDVLDYPVVIDVKEIKALKLLASSSAYWKGDSSGKSLQRVYGIAFPDKEMLDDFLAHREEMKKRDHRKIGKEQELFYFHDTAPGMPYWLPKGLILYNNLIDFWRREHRRLGYQEFSAPQINSAELWKTSGHWAHYKEKMFIIEGPEETKQALKPMSCPNAIILYKMKRRSYKELPLRFNDVDVIHRNENSGELNGLFRVKMFKQDDSHNFIRESQIRSEIKGILELVQKFYHAFGLEFRASLSTRPDDYMGDIDVWNHAEDELRSVLDEVFGEGNYPIKEKDGAFYGPKIDIQMKDSLGRDWQMGTIQLDFQLPINFALEYVDENGKAARPIIIHRVIFGSLERFIGVMTEHFAGAFPLWISPVQVQVIPVSDANFDYAADVANKLENADIRVEVDLSSERLGYKIRHATLQQSPYIIIIGKEEASENKVSVRKRKGENLGKFSIEDFVSLIKKEVREFK